MTTHPSSSPSGSPTTQSGSPGTTLIAVAAVDPDKGLNGLITYTLLNLTPPGYVQLEDSSAGRWEGLPEEGWGIPVCACLASQRGQDHFSPSG